MIRHVAVRLEDLAEEEHLTVMEDPGADAILNLFGSDVATLVVDEPSLFIMLLEDLGLDLVLLVVDEPALFIVLLGDLGLDLDLLLADAWWTGAVVFLVL